MIHPPIQNLLALSFLAICPAMAQNFASLDFSNNIQSTNGLYPNNSTLGPEFYSGSVFGFSNVTTAGGRSIDAKLTLLGSAGSYEFVGWLPHYNEAGGQPADDLGVYYRHTGGETDLTGGIGYTLSFYEGDGTFSTPATLDDVRLLIYDHDGETDQSESIRTYVGDGFSGYQLHTASGIHAHDEGTTWRFDSRGQGHSETSAEGGFIAYYQNTSSIRFDLFSTTNTSLPFEKYGIFAGFDGNLSMADPQSADFAAFASVPEPATFPLVALSALALAFRRRPAR